MESVPGADRGPRAGSPRGVVVATGSVYAFNAEIFVATPHAVAMEFDLFGERRSGHWIKGAGSARGNFWVLRMSPLPLGEGRRGCEILNAESQPRKKGRGISLLLLLTTITLQEMFTGSDLLTNSNPRHDSLTVRSRPVICKKRKPTEVTNTPVQIAATFDRQILLQSIIVAHVAVTGLGEDV